MGRAPLKLAFACLAALPALGCGGGGGDASCQAPTLAQCQDETWLQTDTCGMAEREVMKTESAVGVQPAPGR